MQQIQATKVKLFPFIAQTQEATSPKIELIICPVIKKAAGIVIATKTV